MQLAYITPNDEMQIVDKRNDGSAEVYNFKSIYSDAHSHIHYDSRGNKTIYRSLSNPEYDTHKFYPKLEQAQFGAIQRSSVYNLENLIQNVTTGGLTATGIISYAKHKDSNEISQCDGEQLTKCIATYFNILDDYPNVQDIEIDKELYNSLLNDFEDYKKNNCVNVELDEELKTKLDKCNKEELNLEYKKYYQNLLTNKEVLRFIKEMIDKKDYYYYDEYNKYTKEQCEEEIASLKHIFKILESVEYRENALGIKEKYITFEPGSYEYENITPFICFDIYDMNHYKKVLELLEKKIKNEL